MKFITNACKFELSNKRAIAGPYSYYFVIPVLVKFASFSYTLQEYVPVFKISMNFVVFLSTLNIHYFINLFHL